jgi:hypothetical protein
MRGVTDITETGWDASGGYTITRAPNHSTLDVKTGRGTLRSLHALPLFGVSLLCLL